MTKQITGELFETTWGKMIVYNEQYTYISEGDRITFEGTEYLVIRIISPSRPEAKWSLRVERASKKYSEIKENGSSEKDWAHPTLKEMPFWREGMTTEEYDTEREYYYKNYDLVREGKYKALWKQRMEKNT